MHFCFRVVSRPYSIFVLTPKRKRKVKNRVQVFSSLLLRSRSLRFRFQSKWGKKFQSRIAWKYAKISILSTNENSMCDSRQEWICGDETKRNEMWNKWRRRRTRCRFVRIWLFDPCRGADVEYGIAIKLTAHNSVPFYVHSHTYACKMASKTKCSHRCIASRPVDFLSRTPQRRTDEVLMISDFSDNVIRNRHWNAISLRMWYSDAVFTIFTISPMVTLSAAARDRSPFRRCSPRCLRSSIELTDKNIIAANCICTFHFVARHFYIHFVAQPTHNGPREEKWKSE